ncbi:MAG: GH39 family glycosyl hydrolase [Candidatus Limnocylindrales bacterium]
MSSETRIWHRAAAGLAIAALVSACGLSATPAPTLAPVPTAVPTPTAGLFVDAGSDQGSISPLVYGTNIGPTIWPPIELQPQVQAAKLTTLTYPGGNWGDQYDIQTFQVDQFIAYCRTLGAEPRIVVRLKDSTPDKAAELVKYANVTKGYGVKYWGIGNEPDLYVANGMTDYTVDQYDVDWRAFAKAMRAVDSSIKLIGPDVSQFNASTDPYIQARSDWLSSFLKANGDLVDIVSIHRYPLPKDINTPITVDDLRAGGKEWDQTIPALRALIMAQTGKDLPVAVTELNSSWAASSGTEWSLDSHMNAIWFADVLGHLIEQKVAMVDQFAIATQYGIVGALGVNPIYYDYLMFQQFGTELVRSASDDPLVSVFASKRSDGTLAVMIVNLSATTQTKPMRILGWPGTSAEEWLFDHAHKAEKIGSATLGDGSVTLAAESVTLLIVPKPGV